MTFQPAFEKAIMNDEWITSNDISDPKTLPDIPGYHVLIRPMSIRTETKGGILLPDKFKEDMKYLTTVGRVVKLGDLAYVDSDKFPKGKWCNEGDFVCYGKHTGQKFVYRGIRYILMYDDQILMTIKDVQDIDPTHEMTLAA
jgi:co-chaperonin GroES (HSP10)|tara:strand:+ start:288 stop:713 length:426 start_codon:yes stop_codon:yes gene_type:complete